MKRQDGKVERWLRISMPLEAWSIARQHLIVLEHEAAVQGLDRSHGHGFALGPVLGAVYTLFLMQHGADIERRYQEIIHDGVALELSKVFSPEELASMTGAAAAQFPGLRTSGNGEDTAAGAAGLTVKIDKRVRVAARTPGDLARRLGRQSRAARSTTGSAPAKAHDGAEARDTDAAETVTGARAASRTRRVR